MTSHGDPSNRLKPLVPWRHCRSCEQGHIYRSIDEGIQHLQHVHFSSKKEKKKEAVPKACALEHWLRDDQQYRSDQRLDLYKRYLHIALTHLKAMVVKAEYIRDGVADSSNSKAPKYMLPQSLVKSLESAVMMLIWTSQSLTAVNRYCNHFEEHRDSQKRKREDEARLEDARDQLDRTGVQSMLCLEKAEQDIMLMAYTDTNAGIVSYDSVGPEYILATVMTSLFNRPLYKDDEIDKVFSSFYRKLVSSTYDNSYQSQTNSFW